MNTKTENRDVMDPAHVFDLAAVVSIVHYCINNGIIKQEEVNV